MSPARDEARLSTDETEETCPSAWAVAPLEDASDKVVYETAGDEDEASEQEDTAASMPCIRVVALDQADELTETASTVLANENGGDDSGGFPVAAWRVSRNGECALSAPGDDQDDTPARAAGKKGDIAADQDASTREERGRPGPGAVGASVRSSAMSPVEALSQVLRQGDLSSIYARRTQADKFTVESVKPSPPSPRETTPRGSVSSGGAHGHSTVTERRLSRVALPGMETERSRGELLEVLARRRKD